jgi:hypothetical protein
VDTERYAGRYAAYGVVYEVASEDGKLTFSSQDERSSLSLGRTRDVLQPLDQDRFLPIDANTQEAREADVAFVGHDGSGRATHLVNSVMAARRVADVT